MATAAAAAAVGPSRRKVPSSSTPTQRRPSRTTTPGTVTTAACSQCHTIAKASDDTPNAPSLLCTSCVRHRIARYLDHLNRLRADAKSARERVEALFGGGGGVGDNDEGIAIPDPFGPPSDLPRNPHSTASHSARNTRAQWASLSTTIATRQSQIMASEQDLVALRRRIASKRHDLTERRKRLGVAWNIVETQPQLRGVEMAVQSLRGEMRSVAEELHRARRRKAKALLDLFVVLPPRKQPQWRPNQRQQHVPGAFPTASPTPRNMPPTPTHDWTIASLRVPLPTPSDLTRFTREEINASVAFTARFLWLLSDLYGVALPFSVGLVDKGKWACRVDPLLHYEDARKGGTAGPMPLLPRKEVVYSLHLGKSAYAGMVSSREATTGASPGGGGGGGGGDSTMMDSSIVTLGMSTLTSAMESFVRVGSGNGNASDRQTSTATTPSPSSTSTSPTLQDYRLALTMLSYNASYLSWTQGVRTSSSNTGTMDLLSTAGSILAILYDLCTCTTTSARPRSHVGLLPSANALDEGFTEWRVEVEFGKLVQLHGIGGGRTDVEVVAQRRRVDESYVDAERDARSLVLRDRVAGAREQRLQTESKVTSMRRHVGPSAQEQPQPQPQRRIQPVTPASTRSQSTTTTAATATTATTTTLDVLRKRGQQARDGKDVRAGSGTSTQSQLAPTVLPKSTAAPVPTPTPRTTRAGAVIFNGREIRAASHRSSLLSGGEESGDEWEAV